MNLIAFYINFNIRVHALFLFAILNAPTLIKRDRIQTVGWLDWSLAVQIDNRKWWLTDSFLVVLVLEVAVVVVFVEGCTGKQ